MTEFVIDAYIWVEYLKDSEKGRTASKIIEDNSNELFTSSATMAEIVSKFLRENKDLNVAIDCINSLSILVNLNEEIARLAGKIHFESKKKNKDFGMLDAFVAATAEKIGAKILTGDPDFRNFKNTVFI